MTDGYLPLDACKHGWLYRIRSRNLSVGVYNEPVKGFVGIREKMGHEYLFTEFHYDTGAPFGTVHPMSEIVECPITPLTEHLGTVCTEHGRPAHYDDSEPYTDPVAKHTYRGRWKHEDDGTPLLDDDSARMINNDALFEWLRPFDDEAQQKD